MAGKVETTVNTTEPKAPLPQEMCGIIMPISAIDTYSEDHWSEVKCILDEAIKDAGFTPRIVSFTQEVSIIQKTIIQNLYSDSIVVCDVSGKNPNVMFELGLRLAFDKPCIIIKDDKTDYSFDTAPIEHLTYPIDLNYRKIISFKLKIKEKIIETYKLSKKESKYSPFLKSFGEFKVAKIEQKEETVENVILEKLSIIEAMVNFNYINNNSTKRETLDIRNINKNSNKFKNRYCIVYKNNNKETDQFIINNVELVSDGVIVDINKNSIDETSIDFISNMQKNEIVTRIDPLFLRMGIKYKLIN